MGTVCEMDWKARYEEEKLKRGKLNDLYEEEKLKRGKLNDLLIRKYERTLDVSGIGTVAASDRLSQTVIVHKNRVYGQNQAASASALADLDLIIADPYKLHVMTLLGPEQFDYLEYRLLEWIKRTKKKNAGCFGMTMTEVQIPEPDPGCTSDTPC